MVRFSQDLAAGSKGARHVSLAPLPAPWADPTDPNDSGHVRVSGHSGVVPDPVGPCGLAPLPTDCPYGSGIIGDSDATNPGRK